MMKKENQLTFYEADFVQYHLILRDRDIQQKVSTFLLKYVSIEAFYKKLLKAYKERDGKRLTEDERKKLNVAFDDVKKVLSYYGIEYDESLIERIFGSHNKNYMDCTIKKLRDRLVHNVNDNVIRVILQRYDSIDSDLNAFLRLFPMLKGLHHNV